MKKKYFIVVSMLLMLIAACLMGACSVAPNYAKPTKPLQQVGTEKYTVLYYAGEGGSIEGEWAQKVESGKDCSTITAVAKRDYVFIGWSDGVETETRTDTNITQNLTVTAMFEYHVATVELNYYAGDHGTVVGDVHQIVPYEHRDATYVCAVPDEGYRFQIWSDGVTTDSRVDGSDGKNVEVTAYFERITFEITYLTDGNGWIDGEATQTVYYGEDGKAVTAVPNEGYRFIGWSDRRKEAERSEYGIYWDYQCTAQFEKIINKYHYNLADCYPYRSMELEYGEIEDYPFYVPSPREHYTFDGWMLGEMKVTDEVGKLIVGNEFFDSEERELHAKWIADAKYTYKVLIVYVTEVSGTFQIDSEENGGILNIDYKMTDEERVICHMTTKQVEKYFEYALDGLVDFQIDEYYTQVPLMNELITGYLNKFSLFADEIPEVSEMIEDYQHVAVSCSIFNYETVLDESNKYGKFMPSYCGLAYGKYSYIRRDFSLKVMRGNDITSEFFLNEKNWEYNYEIENPDMLLKNKRLYMEEYVIEPYLHEFIHSIELWIGTYPFHDALADGLKNSGYEYQFGQSIKIEKLYLLNKLLIDGETVGIPYEYWKGEVATVKYLYGEGGYVDAVETSTLGDIRNQGVIISGNSRAVIAEPLPGYRFIGWSDGVTTATRCETNVQGDITVTAYFELIEFTIYYSAGEGGYIEGELTQTNTMRSFFDTVTAIAKEGYVFVMWSDGVTTASRSDYIQITDVERIFGDSDEVYLTAIFEKQVYTVQYLTDGNGIVSGEAVQSVEYGGSTTRVTAVPIEGYRFVGWSDGITAATRWDVHIRSDITLTAIFEKPVCTVQYLTDGNGTISGEAIQSVEYGRHTTKVIAVPNAGYRFIGWSDGLKSVARINVNIKSDITVTACFEPIEYTIYYSASEGGYLEGGLTQTNTVGQFFTTVTAIAKEGYEFVTWSDGVTTASRSDCILSADVERFFGDGDYACLTAIFRKIK